MKSIHKYTIASVSLAGLVLSVVPARAQQVADGFQGTNSATVNYFLGKVGVGTNAPATPFHVVNTNTTGFAMMLDGGGPGKAQLRIRADNTDERADVQLGVGMLSFTAYDDGASEYMPVRFNGSEARFWTDGAERMTVTSDGKVGIGTTTPSVPFHVNNTNLTGFGMMLDGGGPGKAQMRFRADNTNHRADVQMALSTLSFTAYDDSSSDYLPVRFNGSEARFWTDGAERMIVKSDGKVGIGTNTPSQRLHVNGNYIQNVGSGTYEMKVRGGGSVELKATGSMVLTKGAGNKFEFGEAVDTQQMVIDASGNVGIGTNTPATLLHVAGQGRFENGITYIAPLGDLSMGSFTNAP